MGRAVRQPEITECRRCATFCDRVIAPASCVRSACPALYEYPDPLTGRRYMGCVHNVWATEIDVELFRAAERTQAGFGTVKLAKAPLRNCEFSVDRAYGEAFDEPCVNRRFFDAPDEAPDALRTFDLRDRL
jgi:hypothetical protein